MTTGGMLMLFPKAHLLSHHHKQMIKSSSRVYLPWKI